MTDPQAVEWHVVGAQITEETHLAPTGNGLEQFYVVPYVIDSGPSKGHRGVVRLAPDDFTEDKVRHAVDAQVNNVHAVGKLNHASA